MSRHLSPRCRSCSAPIVWGVTEKGRQIPLDPEPVGGGNLELTGERVRYVAAPDVHPDIARHVTHFATCPSAAEHRSR